MITLTNALGDGLFLTGSIVFFTRVVGLSSTQIGLGLSAAGVVGFVASGTLGFLTDRFGAKAVLVTFNALQCIAFIGYVYSRSFLTFAIVACLIAAVDYGKSSASGVIVREIAGDSARVELRARSRAAYNIGVCCGAVLAAAGLVSHARWVYYAIILCDACSFALCAMLASRFAVSKPEDRNDAAKSPSMFRALKNWRFMSVVGLNSILFANASLLAVIVPLWVIHETRAGAWIIGLILFLNTILVILFQVLLSKNCENLRQMITRARYGAFLLVAACAVFGLSGHSNAAFAVILLLAGGVILTFAEMCQSVSAWGITYELAPAQGQGQYLGAFGMSMALQNMIGPGIYTFLITQFGVIGWLVIGISVLVSGFLLGPTARSARRFNESLQ